MLPWSVNLLRSLTSTDINAKELINFVLHIIYNRKRTEKSPGESRYAMLFTTGKGKRGRFTDTRRLPSDEATLAMKFKRAHYVTLGMSLLYLFTFICVVSFNVNQHHSNCNLRNNGRSKIRKMLKHEI